MKIYYCTVYPNCWALEISVLDHMFPWIMIYILNPSEHTQLFYWNPFVSICINRSHNCFGWKVFLDPLQCIGRGVLCMAHSCPLKEFRFGEKTLFHQICFTCIFLMIIIAMHRGGAIWSLLALCKFQCFVFRLHITRQCKLWKTPFYQVLNRVIF